MSSRKADGDRKARGVQAFGPDDAVRARLGKRMNREEHAAVEKFGTTASLAGFDRWRSRVRVSLATVLDAAERGDLRSVVEQRDDSAAEKIAERNHSRLMHLQKEAAARHLRGRNATPCCRSAGSRCSLLSTCAVCSGRAAPLGVGAGPAWGSLPLLLRSCLA